MKGFLQIRQKIVDNTKRTTSISFNDTKENEIKLDHRQIVLNPYQI
jgi:hypothetical protein